MAKRKEYLVTNSCYWYQKDPKAKRNPHFMVVVDPETGEMKGIKNGSYVQVIDGEVHDI